MSDDVKDLLRRAVDWYEPTVGNPEAAVRRSKRRTLMHRIGSGVTALVLFAGSAAILYGAFGGARWLVDRPPANEADAGPRTSTLLPGVTITYPDGWTLVDMWSESADGPLPGSSVPAGFPILQLSNLDLGFDELPSVCRENSSGLPSDAAVLYVAYDVDQLRLAGDLAQTWPVPLAPRSNSACSVSNGEDLRSSWLAGVTPYLAFAYLGPEASASDRETVLSAFASLTFEPARLEASGLPVPAYVIASGVDRGRRWNLEATRGSVAPANPVATSGPEIILDLHQPNLGGTLSDIRTEDLESGMTIAGLQDLTMAWGAVSPRVARVEARGLNGATAVGEVVPLPSELQAAYSAFVISMPDPAGTTIAAYDANGIELASEEFGGGPATGEACPGPVSSPTVPSLPVPTTENVQSWLRNALVAAKTISADCGTYLTVTPGTLAAIEPSLSYGTAEVTTQGTISVRAVSETRVLFVTADVDGTPWCIADDVGAGTTTCGRIDAQTVEECAGGW